MMCAAHSGDLSSAQKLGLRTGHIGRPGEGGPGTGETEPKGSFDVVAKNFHDFADKLGGGPETGGRVTTGFSALLRFAFAPPRMPARGDAAAPAGATPVR